jgi:hypothetical protein
MQAKSGSWRPMSKKKDRGWFICPQWAELISRHYASDIEAGRALKADPKVLSKLRSGTPVAKSTVLKMLRHYCQSAWSRIGNGRPGRRHENALTGDDRRSHQLRNSMGGSRSGVGGLQI